jgi:hypothetical protein
VSYFAQIEKRASVILYSPECVEGAADADSLALILKVTRAGSTARKSDHIQPNSILRRRVHREPAADTFGPEKFSTIESDATPHLEMSVSFAKKEGQRFMPLIQLVEVLIVVGVLLWLVNRFIPMQSSIKSILNGVVVIAVVLWLLNVFGLFHSLSGIRLGKG